ncbi:Maltose permease MAL31 [Trichoderma lentiforme]|uniref:Maltose permease MAL31 n=1 Tax=Trichoderma lentiforme TaxID=1567552 RepID=A0A9P4X432_9HYPO|nr:Maltose permease MAL31 [Trichoderma lentiforme]
MANDDEKVDVVALEHQNSAGGKDVILARQAAEAEHNLSLLQAIRKYPKAVLWSVLLSTSIIMEGYDIVLISSFFAQPSFRKRYGDFDPGSNSYQISASWQNGLSNAVSVGTIIGAFANGYFTHKFGYRKVLLASLLLVVGFVFIPFFAPNLGVLLVGELLCGIPWGVFATMAPAYASEICPMALRGYLTVYVNLCWAFGQLISAGVQSGFENNTTQWSYRIPFAIQWAWPVPLFFILWFAPESPWFYVRQGLLSDAEKTIIRLGADRDMAKQTLAMMIHTNELEESIDKGTSYLDCFRGIDRYRTEIACMAFAAQPFCGSAMGGTPTYFFVQAGLPTSISFKMSVSGLGLASVGTIISWFLMHRLGRRTMYLWGLGTLTMILLVVGFISVGAANSAGGNYAQATMILLWLLVYYMTVGPICYAIIGEVSSTRLRNKSVCLSRIVYYIAQIICNVVNPYMLNPTAGDWRGKTAFFWGFWAFVFFVWTWFRLPETKDKTFEELDILFARGIKAREFASYKVDAYVEGEESLSKNA